MGQNMDDERHCEYSGCGKVLVRRPDEPAYRWRERTNCNAECGRRAGAEKSHRSGARLHAVTMVSSGIPEGISFS